MREKTSTIAIHICPIIFHESSLYFAHIINDNIKLSNKFLTTVYLTSVKKVSAVTMINEETPVEGIT